MKIILNRKKRRKVVCRIETEKKVKRRKNNPDLWQKNQANILSNKGQANLSLQIQEKEDGTTVEIQSNACRFSMNIIATIAVLGLVRNI